MNMPTKPLKPNPTAKHVDKDAYVVTFTDGAIDELENLQKKFNLADISEVIKLGLSVLEQLEDVRVSQPTRI